MNIQHSTFNISKSDKRLAEWLAIVTFAACGYFFAGGGWNQNSQFDLTRAIVERHSFAIDSLARNTGDVATANGHVYSNKSPAISWLAAIPYAALHAIERGRGANPGDATLLTINVWLCSLLCVALPAALIPPMIFIYARRRGIDARWAAIVAASSVLATQVFPYATAFMLHAPSAALLVYALTTPHRARAGFAAALATAMNYLCAPALIVFAFIERRSLARFAAAAIAPLAALAAYQYACFGSVFAISIAHEDSRFLTPGAAMGVFQWPSPGVIYAVTLSPYRGVFFFAPILLVGLFGLRAWWRAERSTCAAALIVIAAFFAFNISFNGWEGGFGIGGRYLVPVIPLMMMALLHIHRRMLAYVATAVSFAINFAVVAVDPQPSATIPRPLTQYIVPLLVHGDFPPSVPITAPWSAATFTGHTSVNRMTLDEAIVFTRHAPDDPASEWASFNLGELATGPGDARSVIPIAMILLGGLILVLRIDT
ncbi:MAG TPA: hypothetical protein VGQ46_15425 [Thermoanaerobaculia bacterium]|nr:hypothetical protein [Thermoanaerobaculia bacterium]